MECHEQNRFRNIEIKDEDTNLNEIQIRKKLISMHAKAINYLTLVVNTNSNHLPSSSLPLLYPHFRRGPHPTTQQ